MTNSSPRRIVSGSSAYAALVYLTRPLTTRKEQRSMSSKSNGELPYRNWVDAAGNRSPTQMASRIAETLLEGVSPVLAICSWYVCCLLLSDL